MTLENFFTESELKDGLTTPDRVNELITVMQKEKDSLVNNFGLWSTVANTVAVTENKNCLDLFVQLDGLFFIDKWLKDAQKLKNDSKNEFSEELIISLLKSLQRLKIDKCSEIGKTVQNLVGYSSIAVSEKAKEFCDKWMLNQDNNVAPHGDKSLEACSSETVEMETKNQGLLDPVDESTDVDRFGVPNSKSEEILEMSTLSADVENTLESSLKTDVLSDKDVAVVDNNESPKTSSNSQTDTEVGNANGGVQSKENSESDTKVFNLSINNDKTDMELDYGIIDPLDIARQVANEVEQDVDSRERSCSTSDSKSGQEIPNQSQSQSQSQLVKEADPKPVKEPEAPASQISEVAQESEPDTGRVLSGFDLNEEVFFEEVDNPVNQVNPINSVTSTTSVVSASPAAFPAQLPASPLQHFGSHKNSKLPFDILDFDLNVADDVEEGKMVILPAPHSGEVSSVANPTKPEIQLLDLNSTGDENVFNQNGWQSPYLSSSSSSSSKQPAVIRKNIDLNLTDQPGFPNSEDYVSIFGTKVEAKKNDYVPNLDFSYRNPNPLFYRPSSHATHMPMPMPMQLPTPMSMPIPYMVDSQRFPFLPQSSSVGQPQHNFNLSNGLMTNNGVLRQFFPQNANEEASSSSSVLGKRREPDSSWEFLPVNKLRQPPWM